MNPPELGTEANPIVIRDGPAPLGSASNPIVIHVDEDWCHGETGQLLSDGDTEIITTPEFWQNLIDESFPGPEKEGADIDLVSVPAPTTPPACGDPELQVIEQSISDCAQMNDKALKMTESTFDVAGNRGIAPCGNGATGQEGRF